MDHRAQIRAKLAADPEWVGDYVTHLVPMLDGQVNSIVYEPEWAKLMKCIDPKKGPYLMETIELTDDAKNLDAAIKKMVESKSTGDLINVLYTDIGPKNEITIISQASDLAATQNQAYPG